MSRVQWLAILGLAGVLAAAPAVHAQSRPYIGFVYPAGGQRGTTSQVKLGGQGLADVDRGIVTGPGVTVKVLEYHPKLGPQDMQLLSEQVRDLRSAMKAFGGSKPIALAAAVSNRSDSAMDSMMAPDARKTPAPGAKLSRDDVQKYLDKVQQRQGEYVQRPACQSISSLVYAEVTVTGDAQPGPCELRLVTPKGISNPLVFYVGQFPEVSRKAMRTAEFQVLGKENLAQRRRPAEEEEQQVSVPCTLNGQIASGERNLYRFPARKGQRLVISTSARELIPFLADAVPGWFQPVLTLCDAQGKELAYDDDYRFKPDPVLYFQVPKDGDYVLSITDAIFRGREDFVYRVTLAEEPFVTSIFPLGARVGTPAAVELRGWNLQQAKLELPPKTAAAGIYPVAAHQGKLVSNLVPFDLDTLPEALDQEPNNTPAKAQKVKTPVIVNGRIDREDDWDVFQVSGRAGQTLVAEVLARRLDSPLDSILKITDAQGKLLGLNDDNEDLGAGTNTHHADSYLSVQLPADGEYFVHIGDAARNGGPEYGYRLRIGPPRPDFALRVVPSSIAVRGRSSNTLSVYAIRKDGFEGPIKLGLKNPPAGFSASSATLAGNQTVGRLTIKADRGLNKPVVLTVEGQAKIGSRDVAHQAVPAEDRMQAFLWRHLVPAQELAALPFDGSYQLPAKRPPPELTAAKAKVAAEGDGKPKFQKSQVAGRLRQLRGLYEEGLLTEQFYAEKVAECEVGQ